MNIYITCIIISILSILISVFNIIMLIKNKKEYEKILGVKLNILGKIK